MRRLKLGRLLDTMPERLALARQHELAHMQFLEQLFSAAVVERVIRRHIVDRRRELRPSIEHRPTDVVPQPLIVEDKVTDGIWELLALPLALESPRFLVTPRVLP